MHYYMCFIWLIQSLQQHCKADTVVIPILQIGKVEHRVK